LVEIEDAPFRPYWWRSPPGISIRPASATPPASTGRSRRHGFSRSIVVAAVSSSSGGVEEHGSLRLAICRAREASAASVPNAFT